MRKNKKKDRTIASDTYLIVGILSRTNDLEFEDFSIYKVLVTSVS